MRVPDAQHAQQLIMTFCVHAVEPVQLHVEMFNALAYLQGPHKSL